MRDHVITVFAPAHVILGAVLGLGAAVEGNRIRHAAQVRQRHIDVQGFWNIAAWRVRHMLDIERGARDRVEKPRIEKRCHGPWFALVAQNAPWEKSPVSSGAPSRSPVCRKSIFSLAFGDKPGLGTQAS